MKPIRTLPTGRHRPDPFAQTTSQVLQLHRPEIMS
jgi:hypothetical protein